MASYYHRILGVSEHASKEEIKKAYRAKARKYHPDVSTHPNAKEHFHRVTEAYNGLMEGRTGPIRLQNSRRQSETNEKQSKKTPEKDPYKPAEDPAERLRKRREKTKRDGLAYYEKYSVSFTRKFTTGITIVSVLLGLLLSFNYYLPYSQEKVFIEKKYFVPKGSGNKHSTEYFFILKKGNTVPVSLQLYSFIEPGDALIYSKSMLLPLVANTQRIHHGFREVKPSDNLLFSWFYFLIIFLFYPLLRYKLNRPHVSFYFVEFSIRTGVLAVISVVFYQIFAA